MTKNRKQITIFGCRITRSNDKSTNADKNNNNSYSDIRETYNNSSSDAECNRQGKKEKTRASSVKDLDINMTDNNIVENISPEIRKENFNNISQLHNEIQER